MKKLFLLAFALLSFGAFAQTGGVGPGGPIGPPPTNNLCHVFDLYLPSECGGSSITYFTVVACGSYAKLGSAAAEAKIIEYYCENGKFPPSVTATIKIRKDFKLSDFHNN